MSGRRQERVRHAIARVIPDGGLVAVDIGARGDIPAPWLPLDGLASFISFDADPAACARLREVYAERGNADQYQVLPIALAGQNGTRTLFATSSGGGSSFFNMDTPLVRAYTDEDYLFPIREVEIETRRALEVFRELDYDSFHLLKLDIQGAELEVLQSLGNEILDGTLVVQLEAALQPKGVGCPYFADVDAFVRAAGFELYDLEPTHVHRSLRGKRSNYTEGVFKVHRTTPTIAGRAWEVEALYCRSPEALAGSANGATMRRLAVCFGLYGLYTEALHCLDVAGRSGLLDGPVLLDLRSAVVEWHRYSESRWWHGLSPLARFARTVARRLRRQSPAVRGALET